jgi:hypothetical protein
MISSFIFFGLIFQFLVTFTRINILKPIILIGTFSLAMAFAANDLVNFIGVPMAGMEAYKVAWASPDPMNITMGALQKKVQSDTFVLLGAGIIMVITLWVSRKARTVSKTEVSLARQDEGVERFGSFALSRAIVGMATTTFDLINRILPSSLRMAASKRLDPTSLKPVLTSDGTPPSFDLLRASVNLMVASAVVSFATSLKLPLSTTYVTFMVAMGTSLSDQAWGKESAVYRVTGVLTVVGGWFFTALTALTVSFIFACALTYLKAYALVGLLLIVGFIIWKSFAYHTKREEEAEGIASLNIKDGNDAAYAVNTSFEQTGYFLNQVSKNLRTCFDAILSEDRYRIKSVNNQTNKVQQFANIIIANIFQTLYLIDKKDAEHTRKYSKTVGALQEIAESHRDIIKRVYYHMINYHSGLLDPQKEELKHVCMSVNRLLENTAIMLLKRKKVDYDYIENQCNRLDGLINGYNKNQLLRIQTAESKTRLSILYYGIIENCEKISTHTRNLLDIFRDNLMLDKQKNNRNQAQVDKQTNEIKEV